MILSLLTAGAAAVTAALLWDDDDDQSAVVVEAEVVSEPEVVEEPVEHGPVSSALVRLGKEGFEFVTELFDLGDESRQEQLATLSDTEEEEDVDAHTRELHKQMGVSLSALGLSVTGALVAPPLSLLSAPLLGYIAYARIADAYGTLVRERRLSMSVLDALVAGGVLATGMFVAGSVAYTFSTSAMLLLKQTESSSRRGLIDVFGQQPRTVWLLTDGVEVEVPLESLRVGCEVVVHAGSTIPIDGVVVSGMATVDQRALTGESQPIIRSEGDDVLASTTVLAGSLVIRALRTGDATTAGRIGEILNRTADFELDMQLRGMKIADRSVLPTILLGGLALSVVGVPGAMAVLVSSIGWPLMVLTPLALHSFLRRISELGVLIKDGRALELLSTVDTVVFDKTGTLTVDQPRISSVNCLSSYSEQEVLSYAAAAEHRQSHPIARAILAAADEQGVDVQALDEVRYELGRGILGLRDGVEVRVGSEAFMREGEIELPEEVLARQRAFADLGRSMVLVAVNGELVGTLEWQPAIREEVRELIAALERRGMKTVVISGDREAATRHLCAELGIDEFHAEVLPGDKAALIEGYQLAGRSVCFVGDGINDTLALKNADVSISLAGATSAAVDTAQIVLMDGSLTHLEALFGLADEFEQVIDRNFWYALAPGSICMFGGFFLGMGLISSWAVQIAGLAAGVRNARS